MIKKHIGVVEVLGDEPKAWNKHWVSWNNIPPEIQRALEGEEIYDIEETPNIFDGGSVKVTFWYKPAKKGREKEDT